MRRPRVTSFVPALAILVLGALAVNAVQAAVVLASVARGEILTDWTAFYAAAHLVWDGAGRSLYDASAQEAMQRALFGPSGEPFAFTQPAFVAVAMAPLGVLSFRASYWVWMAVNIAVGGPSLAALWRAFAGVSARRRAATLALAATSTPALAVILNGQLEFFALAGLVGCYAMVRRGHPFAAGAALTLALAKPQLATGAALLLLVARQWRPLVSFAALGLPLLIVPAVTLGPGTLADQTALLFSFARSSEDLRVHAEMMANIRGAVVSLTGSGSALLWGPPFLIVASTAFVVSVRTWSKASTSPEQAWALAFLVPLLVSPHLHVQSLTLLAGFAALYARAADAAGRPLRWEWLLGGFAGATALWAMTMAGFAALVALSMAAFTVAARRWPEPATAAAGRELARAA
ncbi:MAG TPA: glycosyltransferase family 87 protein [Dehalococcoidia bacterium]|nr:glycosyltransferase family 87 protein [Dehalococcoidia bacterium]